MNVQSEIYLCLASFTSFSKSTLIISKLTHDNMVSVKEADMGLCCTDEMMQNDGVIYLSTTESNVNYSYSTF